MEDADDALFLQIMMMDSMWLDGHQQAKLDSARPRPSAGAPCLDSARESGVRLLNHGAVEVEKICEVSSRSDCSEGLYFGAREPGCSSPANTGSSSRAWDFLQHQDDFLSTQLQCADQRAERGDRSEPFTATGDSEVFRQIMGEPLPEPEPKEGLCEANGAASLPDPDRPREGISQEVAGAGGGVGGGGGNVGAFNSSFSNIQQTRPQHKQFRGQTSHNCLSGCESSDPPSFIGSRESSTSLSSLGRDTSGYSEPMGQPLGRLNQVFQDMAMGAADIAAGADAPATKGDIDGISGIEFVRGDKSMTAAATLSLIMRLEALEAATSNASTGPEIPQGAARTASSDTVSCAQLRGVVNVQSSCGPDETVDEGEPEDRESNVAGKGKRRHVSSSDEEVEAGAARKDVEAANADAVAGIFPENAACAWMLHGRPQPFPKNSRQFDEDKSPRGSWNRHVSSLQRGGEGWPESSMPNISSHRGSWIRPSSPGLPNLRRSNSPTSGMCVECNVTSGVSLPASRRFSQDTRGFASYPSSPLGSVADGTGRRHSTSSPAAMLLKSPAVRAALGSSWLLPNPIEDFANAHQAGEKAARAGDGDDEALDDDDDDDDGEPTVFALSKSKRAASEGE